MYCMQINQQSKCGFDFDGSGIVLEIRIHRVSSNTSGCDCVVCRTFGDSGI